MQIWIFRSGQVSSKRPPMRVYVVYITIRLKNLDSQLGIEICVSRMGQVSGGDYKGLRLQSHDFMLSHTCTRIDSSVHCTNRYRKIYTVSWAAGQHASPGGGAKRGKGKRAARETSRSRCTWLRSQAKKDLHQLRARNLPSFTSRWISFAKLLRKWIPARSRARRLVGATPDPTRLFPTKRARNVTSGP